MPSSNSTRSREQQGRRRYATRGADTITTAQEIIPGPAASPTSLSDVHEPLGSPILTSTISPSTTATTGDGASRSSPRSRSYHHKSHYSQGGQSSDEEKIARLLEDLEEKASGVQQSPPSPKYPDDKVESKGRHGNHSHGAYPAAEATARVVPTQVRVRRAWGMTRFLQTLISHSGNMLICLWKERILIPMIIIVVIFAWLAFYFFPGLHLSYGASLSGIVSGINSIGSAATAVRGALSDSFSAVTNIILSIFHLSYKVSRTGIDNGINSVGSAAAAVGGTIGSSFSVITNTTVLMSVALQYLTMPLMFIATQKSPESMARPTNISYYKVFHYSNGIAKPLANYNQLFFLANEAGLGESWLRQVSIVANEAANAPGAKIADKEKVFLRQLSAKNREYADAIEKLGPFLGNFTRTRDYLLKRMVHDLSETHNLLERHLRWEADPGMISLAPWIMKRERSKELQRFNSFWMTHIEFSTEAAHRLLSIAEEGTAILKALQTALKDIDATLSHNIAFYHSRQHIIPKAAQTTQASGVIILPPWQFTDGRTQKQHLDDRKRQYRNLVTRIQAVKKSMSQVTKTLQGLATKLKAAHEALLVLGPCSLTGATPLSQQPPRNATANLLVQPSPESLRGCLHVQSWTATLFSHPPLSLLTLLVPVLASAPPSHIPSGRQNVTYVLDMSVIGKEEITRWHEEVKVLGEKVGRESQYSAELEERRRWEWGKKVTQRAGKARKNGERGER